MANHLVGVNTDQPFPQPSPTPTTTLTPTGTFTTTSTGTQTATVTQTPTTVPTATTAPPNGNVEYVYDGDGNLVKSIINDVETYYASPNYQLLITGSQEVESKYYSAGSSRIAYRINGAITWLLNDHLGSTVGTVDADGELIGVLKYTAYGELRTGSSTTDYRYTGQREEAEIGLYYYVARFFDPAVGRFISADTIVPDPASSQGYDRFSYVSNNPINRNDPSGHCYDEDGDGSCDSGWYEPISQFNPNQEAESSIPLQSEVEIPITLPTVTWNDIGKYTSTTPTPKTIIGPRYSMDEENHKYSNDGQEIPIGFLIGAGFANNSATSNSGSAEVLLGKVNALYLLGSYGSAIGEDANAMFYIGQTFNIYSPEDYLAIDPVRGITIASGPVGFVFAYGQDESVNNNRQPAVFYLGLAPGLGFSIWESHSLTSWFFDFKGEK